MVDFKKYECESVFLIEKFNIEIVESEFMSIYLQITCIQIFRLNIIYHLIILLNKKKIKKNILKFKK
jgi:hypothetical protein